MKRTGLKTEINGVCGMCVHATPDYKFENLSINGEPTLVSCPFRMYKQNINQRGCVEWKQRKDCER